MKRKMSVIAMTNSHPQAKKKYYKTDQNHSAIKAYVEAVKKGFEKIRKDLKIPND